MKMKLSTLKPAFVGAIVIGLSVVSDAANVRLSNEDKRSLQEIELMGQLQDAMECVKSELDTMKNDIFDPSLLRDIDGLGSRLEPVLGCLSGLPFADYLIGLLPNQQERYLQDVETENFLADYLDRVIKCVLHEIVDRLALPIEGTPLEGFLGGDSGSGSGGGDPGSDPGSDNSGSEGGSGGEDKKTSCNDCTNQNPCVNAGEFFPACSSSDFVQCGEASQCFILSCPSGLVWNQATSTCDFSNRMLQDDASIQKSLFSCIFKN